MGAGLIPNQSTKWLGIIPRRLRRIRWKSQKPIGKPRSSRPSKRPEIESLPEVEIRSAYNARQYNLTQKKAQIWAQSLRGQNERL